MSDPSMAAVEALCVDAVELAHALCQVPLRCLDQDMVVVGHLAPGMAYPVVAFADLTKDLQPGSQSASAR